ncbi:alanyl-tRNA synthetase [Leuconostoc pseudomesenteroides]|uniref:alanyl-tRNA synthetase n=2 Tax=Lactobacillaceae TaxID=33958 RepID=UPI001F54BEF3|nr:alanyl-tRNA synthetase [Leuconostoc pseudomesenteroides]
MSDNQANNRHKKILYAVIAILAVLVIALGVYTYKLSHRSTTTIVTAPTKSVSSEKASSSTKKYVAGKDYKITYSNTNLIGKEQINKALGANYLNDINSLMSTKKPSGLDMAKVEVYYNKDKNLLVENLFKNGHSSNEATTAVVYDLKNNQIVNSGVNYDTNYQPSWIVYTWERLTE